MALLVSRRRRTLIVIAVLVLAVPALALFVVVPLTFKPYRIPSQAMEPTLKIGDRLLVRTVGDYEPERGDIVVFKGSDANEDAACGDMFESPRDPRQPCPVPGSGTTSQRFVFRIVALGGERIRVERGRAVVNGRRLDEPYVEPDESCDICNLPREAAVPPGHVFVMGDNRGASADSRLWGPVREDAIIGAASVRYYPVDRWGSP